MGEQLTASQVRLAQDNFNRLYLQRIDSYTILMHPNAWYDMMKDQESEFSKWLGKFKEKYK